MRSGRLSDYVTVYKKSVVQDSTYGSETVSWIPLVYADGSPAVGERWAAEVLDMIPSKSESVRMGLTVARNQVRVRLRYRADIKSDMRIVVHGASDRTLEIVGGPAVLGRNEGLEMMCEEVTT